MDTRPTELERAFQLAKSGECQSVDEIRKKLCLEGYYATQVTGKGLLKQLQGIIAAELEARGAARERPGRTANFAEARRQALRERRNSHRST